MTESLHSKVHFGSGRLNARAPEAENPSKKTLRIELLHSDLWLLRLKDVGLGIGGSYGLTIPGRGFRVELVKVWSPRFGVPGFRAGAKP